VLSADGALVRSVSQINGGDQLTTRLADGAFASRVETTSPNKLEATSSSKPASRRNASSKKQKN
jgi:hypothetical protein